jgi:hypothetical protein
MPDDPHGPRRFRRWLEQPGNSPTVRLLREAGRLAKLAEALGTRLPPSFAGHWQLAQVHPQSLVLVADSPAWGAQLRFWQAELLDAVAADAGFRPRTLQVRASGYKAHPRAIHPRRQVLSAQSAGVIAGAAATTQDARLRQALERLARAGVKKR